jgi:hypothetical protein
MGCACGKPASQEANAFPNANIMQDESKRKRPKVSMGTPVKQVSPEERREKQLAAAEDRARKEAQRGLSSDSRKGAQISESARRLELIGKIQAHYSILRRDPPMGLSLASVEQLQKHLDSIKKGAGQVNGEDLVEL